MKDSTVPSAVVTHQAMKTSVCESVRHAFGFICPLQLINFNIIALLLTHPALCRIMPKWVHVWVKQGGKWVGYMAVQKKKPAWLAPGWLCGGVCLKERVERKVRAHGQSPCLIRTLVCPRLIVSWAPRSKDPPLHHWMWLRVIRTAGRPLTLWFTRPRTRREQGKYLLMKGVKLWKTECSSLTMAIITSSVRI